MNRYTYRLEWSPHYDEYIGSCLEFPFVRRQAPTRQQALADIAAAVDEYLANMHELGETPPAAITDRPYSGTFVVRTSSELHGRLAREAAEERVSMNHWVVQKLSGRKLSDGHGLSGFD